MNEQRASAAPQEPVAFDHSIGDGRFRPVKSSFWWQIEIGDGTARYGKFHSKLAAEDMCLRLLCAYRDGAFAQHLAAAPQPQAPSSDDVRDKRIAELEAKIHTLTNRADMRRKHLRRLESARADARDALRWYYHRNCADSLMGFDDFVTAAAKEGRALRANSET